MQTEMHYAPFASFNETTGHITFPKFTETTGELVETEGIKSRISYLSNAIDNLLDTISNKLDFISWGVCRLSNLSSLSKGFLANRQFCTQHCKSFDDTWDKSSFIILQEDSSLHNAELLLGKASENLTKGDTTININATILQQM